MENNGKTQYIAENVTGFTEADEHYMTMALQFAQNALESGDVPVGAIIVRDKTGEIIATGHNTQERDRTSIGHAEINAVQAACEAMGDWRLSGCTLYVTLEPCPMCAGALLHSRISRIIYGASDPTVGAMGSVWSLHEHPSSGNRCPVKGGCLEEPCRHILQDFFAQKRATGNEEG